MRKRGLITEAEMFKKLKEAGISYGFEAEDDVDELADWDIAEMVEDYLDDYYGNYTYPDEGVTEGDLGY